ncbi:hypothetical protein HZA97_10115 [Candidatus Woesearchaeota archaeon]|nr:hypothetical protein [Candidatus Woesearchaeota archaeon]
MNEQTLDTRMVKDWKEVLPVVRPFYEGFFGEKVPEDLSIEMVPFEELVAHGMSNILTGEMKLAIQSMREVAKTFFHERAHYLFEQNSGLGVKHRQNSVSARTGTPEELSFFDNLTLKPFWRHLFLEECVAYTVEAVFAFQNSAKSMPEEDKISLKSDSNFVIDNYVNKYSVKKLREGVEERHECIIIGAYLGDKYKNDPQLWSKLKQLRTLDDLRRLVNDS